MKYTIENLKKALDEVLQNDPHNLGAIKSIYEIAKKDHLIYACKALLSIKLEDILASSIWSKEEKAELIKTFEYQTMNQLTPVIGNWQAQETAIGNDFNIVGINAVDYSIIKSSLSGLEAALELGANISICSVAALSLIKDPSIRLSSAKLLIKYFGDKENIEAYGVYSTIAKTVLPNLCDTYFIGDWKEVATMKYIINTGDTELLNLFMPIVKKPSRLLRFAIDYDIKHKCTTMTNIILENGADVNYQEEEFKKDNGVVEWHSDDAPYEESSILKIEKSGEQIIITFVKSANTGMSLSYRICICNSASRHNPFNNNFMDLCHKLNQAFKDNMAYQVRPN